MRALLCALCAVIGYLFGSVSGSIAISKIFYKSDIRTHGSGNAGMTNMLRTFGAKAAVGTAVTDIAKTVAAMLIANAIFGDLGMIFAGIGAVLGHAFPVFFGFKGGKSAVCTAIVGCFFDYKMVLCAFVIYFAVLFISGIMSLATISGMLAAPIFGFIFGLRGFTIIAMAAICLFVIFMHRSNIKRLVNGTETRIIHKGGKSK